MIKFSSWEYEVGRKRWLHCSFVHSSNKYFIEHLLCVGHFSRIQGWAERVPAITELILWRTRQTLINSPPNEHTVTN